MDLKSNMPNDSFLLNMSCSEELLIIFRNITFLITVTLIVLAHLVFKSHSLTMTIPDNSSTKGASFGINLSSFGYIITSAFQKN